MEKPMPLLVFARKTGAALTRSVRGIVWRRFVTLESIKRVLSVTLSVAVAHLLDCDDKWWVAISAFMVMRSGWSDSVQRGVHRVVGTVCGALLGYWIAPWAAGHPLGFVVVLCAATWAGMFASLIFSYGYGWTLMTVTFVMIFFEGFRNTTALSHFAISRVVDVVVGTLTCVGVAAVFDPVVRGSVRRALGRSTASAAASSAAASATATSATADFAADAATAPAAAQKADQRVVSPQYAAGALLASQAAIAVVVLALLAIYLRLSIFPQAMVSVIAVLIVPLQAAPDAITSAVTTRMMHRFLGCLLAGLLAFALLHIAGPYPAWSLVMLAGGVWLGSYIQAGPQTSYIGTQFTVAFIMVFVQDHPWASDLALAFERLMGIITGIAVLALVMSIPRLPARFLRHR
jgi:uncharacterized membrane protein YccC